MFKNFTSLTIDDGNFLYAAIGDIYKYKLKRNVNNYCPITIKSENQVALMIRDQWTGFEGSPKTQLISYYNITILTINRSCCIVII